MRIIGLDVHRTFAEVTIREHGRVRPGGRISTTPAGLQLFARSLTRHDEVVLEATCNTHAIARLLRAHAWRVVVSNPLRTRAIAEAKIKTDKIDAAVLTQLHASGFLPEVSMPDATTEARRRQVNTVARGTVSASGPVGPVSMRGLVPLR
jgi:transposase